VIHVNAVNNVGAHAATDAIIRFENKYIDFMNTELSGRAQSCQSTANNDNRH
jgi:hypothetical protein